MNANEAYLEKLLRAMSEPEEDTEEEIPAVEEEIPMPEEEPAVEEDTEDTEAVETEPEPEPSVINDDPNRVMTPEEIAQLLAANEEDTESDETQTVEAEAESPEINDDPNRVMTPEEIAQLLAANEEDTESDETQTVEAESESPEINDDPNRVMTPEEIAQLLATNEEDTESDETQTVEVEAESPEINDDPNRVMTPEEIAQLLAANEAMSESEEITEIPEETIPEVAEESVPEESEEVIPEVTEESIPEEVIPEDLEETVGSPEVDMMLSEESLADLLEAIPELSDGPAQENAQGEPAANEDAYEMPDGLTSIDLSFTEESEVKQDEAPEGEPGREIEIDLSDRSLFEIPLDDEIDESLASALSETDADSAAVNALLSADEEGTLLDDDVLSILESGEDDMPGEGGGGAGADDGGDESVLFADIEGLDLREEGADEGKKKGLLARIIEAIFGKKGKKGKDGDDDDEAKDGGLETGNIAGDENMEILKQLDEDEDEPPKKKEKKKKEKKEKPKKEKKKTEKKPKSKKEKKPKKERVIEYEPGKPISKKFIIAISFMSISFLALFILAISLLPGFIYAREARAAFAQEDYETVYRKLAGLKLKGSDEQLYQKSFLLMKMKRYDQMCDHWMAEGDMVRAVDVMVQAVGAFDRYAPTAQEFGVYDIYTRYYDAIRAKMDTIPLSEDQARTFALITDETQYSIAIEDYLFGEQDIEPNIPDEVLRLYEEGEAGTEGEEGTEEEPGEDAGEEGSGDAEEEYEEEEEDDDGGESEDLFTFDVQQDSQGNYHAGE
ncbi:MAG: hypothetical protein IJM23_09005 [Lachnospiraceae bacterium]|nr:hypothetical protein [Lachnospiraceae bacterium]